MNGTRAACSQIRSNFQSLAFSFLLNETKSRYAGKTNSCPEIRALSLVYGRWTVASHPGLNFPSSLAAKWGGGSHD